MKPLFQFDDCRFRRTDFFFQSGAGRWHDYGSNDDGEFNRHDLGREYLIEAAHERAKEMVVFAIILAAATWPVLYMIFTIVRVFHQAAR